MSTQGLEFAVTFVKGPRGGLEVEEETYGVLGSFTTLRPDMPSDELQLVLRDFRPLGKLSHHEFTVSRNRFFLNWFQRDPKTGNTKVTSADLDENGAFGDWPEDFDAVALSTQKVPTSMQSRAIEFPSAAWSFKAAGHRCVRSEGSRLGRASRF